jgi:F-type H+-transporting ATPase subunit b
MSKRAMAILLLILMVPIAAWASAEGENPKGVMDVETGAMIWTFITFVVLLLLLRVTAWKPLIATLNKREETIRNSIEEAKKAKDEAQRLVDDHKAKVHELEKTVEAELQKGRAQAEALGAEITEKAKEEANRIKKKIELEIQKAKEEALLDIRNEVLNLSTSIASKILQRNLKPEDQAKIVDQVLAEVGRKS